MADKMVTVARFSDPVQAAMARNRLEEVGLRSMLNNEETAVIGWQLGASVGTIELLVAETDAEAAQEALFYRHLSLGEIQRRTEASHPEGVAEQDTDLLHRSDITTPEAVEEDEEPANPRGEKVDRAFRSALFGVMLFPLAFYALYLLFDIFLGEEPIPASHKVKAWIALLVCIPMVLLGLLFVRYVVAGP